MKYLAKMTLSMTSIKWTSGVLVEIQADNL